MSDHRELCVPEWIQREIAEREAEARAVRRLEWTRLALVIAAFALAAHALWVVAR